MELVPNSEKIIPSNQFSLKKNFLFTLVGNLSYAFSQLMIILLIAKFGTPEMVGRYALALAITAPVFLLVNVNLRTIQATDTKNEYKFIEYFYNRNIANIIGLLIIWIILSGINLNKETQIIVFIMAFCRIFESICDVSFGLFQQHERMDFVSVSKIIQSLLSVLFVTIAIILFNNIGLAVALIGLSFLLTFLIYNLKKIYIITGTRLDIFKRKVDFKKIIVLFVTGLPLGIAASLDSFNANIPRYFLQYYMDEKSVGFFSAIAFIMASGGMIITSMAQSVTPRLARLYNTNLKSFRNLIRKLIILAVGIGLIGVLVSWLSGDIILGALYGPEYKNYNNIFVLIMIGAAIWYMSSFLGTALVSTRKFNSQMTIYVITTIVSLAASFFLIPLYGLTGAALTVVLCHITRLTITFILYYLYTKV
ncbi:oligosaccharide flippase family protein [Bacillus sp. V2I10]|uniref:oligosaccharide flippase family protein n=1 Tax=Bacillus sp. V2I10 TaxID=3042276 RepID=UPI00278BA642|nr:oligosaccharide flippase family protein [Bacillus sp. V2I10]MDQ0857146.1 O-antigen/teichoic acid export membrane protein [Bacillus sp. V2I10]